MNSQGDAVAKAINDACGQVTAVPGDMLNSQYVDGLVKKAAAFGEGKVPIIVNSQCPLFTIIQFQVSPKTTVVPVCYLAIVGGYLSFPLRAILTSI